MCDSATWIRSYTGGCVVGSIAPVFILDGNDPKVVHSTRHWWAALYHADQTLPDKPYTKQIPGAWNPLSPNCARTLSGPGGCLHRTLDKARQDANRDDVAVPQCKIIKPGYKKPDSCDEYPFATTMEGAASTTNDYSVRIVLLKDNCSSGARTGVFYTRNRIRQYSPFWVDVRFSWHVQTGERGRWERRVRSLPRGASGSRRVHRRRHVAQSSPPIRNSRR